MAEESDLERTEAPSQRRLEQAREEGQVPRSREVNTFALLAAAGLGLWIGSDALRHAFSGRMRSGVARERAAVEAPGSMLERLYAVSIDASIAIAPLLAVLFIVALVSPMMLSGWLVSSKAFTPRLVTSSFESFGTQTTR